MTQAPQRGAVVLSFEITCYPCFSACCPCLPTVRKLPELSLEHRFVAQQLHVDQLFSTCVFLIVQPSAQMQAVFLRFWANLVVGGSWRVICKYENRSKEKGPRPCRHLQGVATHEQPKLLVHKVKGFKGQHVPFLLLHPLHSVAS